MDARELEGCNRAELIARADAIGVDNANVLTRTELVDEIVRRSVSDPIERQRARGLLGIARDLVARVVERGLHLPDAAAIIRGGRLKPSFYDERPPIATVTLAEIYANQGHRARALAVLDEVLATEPDHAAARGLRDRVAASSADEPAADVTGPAPLDTGTGTGTGTEGVSLGAQFTDAVDVAASQANSAAATAQADDERANDASGDAAAPVAGDPVPEAAERLAKDLRGDEPLPFVAPEPVPHVQGPVGMLDDAPLPPFYDVDEVVLMPVDPTTVYLYWEVRRSTLEEAQMQAPEGKLVLRILAVTPNPAAPTLTMRDVDLPDLVGDWVMRDMPIGAVLRAAVGWRRGSAFAPLSVAMELTAPPAAPASTEAHQLARFGLHATTDEPLDGELAAQVLGPRRSPAGAASHRESVSWEALPSS